MPSANEHERQLLHDEMMDKVAALDEVVLAARQARAILADPQSVRDATVTAHVTLDISLNKLDALRKEQNA